MSRRISMLTAVLLAVLFAAGCSGKTAATVNGEKITKKEVQEAAAARMGPAAATMQGAAKKAAMNQALQELIAEKIAFQEARARGIVVTDQDVDNEVANLYRQYGKDAIDKQAKQMNLDKDAFRQAIKKRIIVSRLAESLVPASAVSDDDARQFYNSQPGMFKTPERANVRLVRTANGDQAKVIAARMKAGGSFDRVADQYVNDKSVSVSDYGWPPTNIYGPEIEKNLGSMKAGSFAGPFKVHDGFVIISLKEKQPAGMIGFDEVKDQIKEMLLAQKRQASLINLIAQKKSTASIKINE